MAADVQTLQYIIKFKTEDVAVATAAIKNFKAQIEPLGGKITEASEATKSFGINVGGLAARAAITIPIWLAIRTAMLSTIAVFTDGAKRIVEFDTAMKKMQAVSSGVQDLTGFMSQLGDEIQQLSITTGKSLTEISDLYYQLAETGMKATEAQDGMRVSLQLAIGTFGDMKETGRMMVDLYNMFGQTMDSNLTPVQKMQTIAGTFVTLWKENAGSLGEYINALKMFAPIAKQYNLSMQDTLTMSVVLNNYMQRGTMGGTQLRRAFSELTKNAEKFESLGIRVRGRSDWNNVFMEMLATLSKFDDVQRGPLIASLFGERSRIGVSTFAMSDALERLLGQLNKIRGTSLDQAIQNLTDAFDLQVKSLQNQIKVFDQLRSSAGAAFLQGLMGATSYEDAISKVGESLFKLNDFIRTQFIPGIQAFGLAINLLMTDPILKLGMAITAVALLLRGLPILVAGISTAMATNPIGLTLLAIAAAVGALTLALAKYKAQAQGIKNEYLSQVEAAGKAGKPVDEFLNQYTKPGGAGELDRKRSGWWEIFSPLPTVEDAPEWQEENRRVGGASNEEIIAAHRRGAALQIKAQLDQEAENRKKIEEETAQIQDESVKTQIAAAQRLKAYGYDALTLAQEEFRIRKESGESELKLMEARRKILEEQIALVNEYADILKSSLEKTFVGIMSGEQNWSDLATAINSSFAEGYRKSVSEGVTNMIMATGIGEIFGSSMASIKGVFGGISGKIEGAFDIGGKTTYNWIVRGFADGRSGHAIGVAGASGGTVSTAGMTVAAGGLLGTVANQGWFSKSSGLGYNIAGGESMTNGVPTGGVGNYVPGKKGAFTRGQVAVMGLDAAMTGYSAYQSAKLGGQSPMMSMGAGILGGLGGLAGGIAGGLAATAGATMLGMGPIGWAVLAGALIVGSLLMGSMGKKGSTQTSIETKTQEMRVASRIDVSNKKLELINRNLVALRNVMETYILPSSAYFSESLNLSDQFSISARR